jgi:drug/metabolite transporter (DMT)-like permease
MNYASPSILAPFSGLTLVWVILGSPLVNNEKPSSQQVLACCLIISGEVIVAIFGDHTTDEDTTLEEVVGFVPFANAANASSIENTNASTHS